MIWNLFVMMKRIYHTLHLTDVLTAEQTKWRLSVDKVWAANLSKRISILMSKVGIKLEK